MRRRITTAKREEIEAEQRLLDKQIVRPFETVEGLPISFNKPPHGHYEDVLKNPLTMKDSAVLYNSLIRSRNTYVFHAPMFKLYWVKQTAYAKKLAELEKGPQPSKERETRRRFAKATSNSLEAKTRTPILSGDVNARDVMSKLSEATLSLGPHSMEIRIFIAKDARSEKSKAFSEISQVSDGSDLLMRKEPPMSAPPPQPAYAPPPGPPMTASGPTVAQSLPNSAPPLPPVSANPPPLAPVSSPNQSQPDSKPAPTPAQAPAPAPAPASTTPKANTPISNEGDEKGTSDKKDNKGKTTNEKPNTGKSGNKLTKAPAEEEKKASSTPNPTSQTPTPAAPPKGTQPTTAQPAEAGTAPAAVPPPPPRAVDMTSVDNAIMISNLNAIAKIDLSLNDLMKVVAKGTASEAQINLFKRYIERAKQMGPQPHHAELYLVRGLPLPPSFPRPYLAKPFAPPRPPRPRFNNPLKLTAFQEKYLYNATLVFEFLENPNVRYVIPRDSVCEVLPPANPVTLEDGSGVRDVLISNIWIHNIEDVEIYEKKLAEYEAEVRAKELEEKKKKEAEEQARKQEEDGENASQSADANAAEEVKTETEEGVSQRSSRSGRNKRLPPPKKKAKPLEKPEEPQVRFTTYSFTLHGIPEKFIPIVVNSMRPLNLVQEKMEKILKIGTRVNSYHLWYQVDAKLDEDIADDLRQSLIQEERKMTGVTSQSIDREPAIKRKREFKNPRQKKPRNDSPSGGFGTPSSQFNGSNSASGFGTPANGTPGPAYLEAPGLQPTAIPSGQQATTLKQE